MNKDELRTRGEICGRAGDETGHMIIGRLVERIDVEDGNKITITNRVSFEQFMNKEQVSVCARHTPRGVRNDGLCGFFRFWNRRLYGII